jgi:hypothetical protein
MVARSGHSTFGANRTVVEAAVVAEDASVTSSSSGGRQGEGRRLRHNSRMVNRAATLTCSSTSSSGRPGAVVAAGCNGGIERAAAAAADEGQSTAAVQVTRTASGAVGSGPCPRSHSIRTISNAKIKTVKLTVAVVAGYLICSAPFVFVQLYTVWAEPGKWKMPQTAKIDDFLRLIER